MSELFAKKYSLSPEDLFLRMDEEEHTQCDAIDNRITVLTNEFFAIADEIQRTVKLLEKSGWTKRLMYKCKLHELHEKLNINRDLRITLLRKRIALT